MQRIPDTLQHALRPITIVTGHYGVGKTNFAVNLALDCAKAGKRTTVIDLDIVNPYFRATEQRDLLESHGVALIAPVFAERGSSLDTPSLTGAIAPKLQDADDDEIVIVDLGGDDVGAGSIGRFSRIVSARDYALLYVINRHRNLVQDPADALENLREIEAATRLKATALVDNAHMKGLTDSAALADENGYAKKLEEFTGLEVVAKTCPATFLEKDPHLTDCFQDMKVLYTVELYVKNPWE